MMSATVISVICWDCTSFQYRFFVTGKAEFDIYCNKLYLRVSSEAPERIMNKDLMELTFVPGQATFIFSSAANSLLNTM